MIEWGYAKNEDTPNLSFDYGSFINWERYYAYFGPTDFMDFNSPNIYTDSRNASSVSNTTNKWTLKNGDADSYYVTFRHGSQEVHGTFSVVTRGDNGGYDINMQKNGQVCTRALPNLPDGFDKAAIVGGTGTPEILYDYNTSDGWKLRAMAERLLN